MAIIATVVGLQCATTAVILVSSYLTSERAVLGQSHKLMIEEAESAIRHTRRFLEPAETKLVISKQLEMSGAFESVSPITIERYFFENLKASPEISGLFYGDREGNFIFVSRSDEIEEAEFRTKVIARDHGKSGASLVYRNSAFEEKATRFDATDTYDPRQRPWYKDAVARGRPTWTDPYIFYSSQEPGITVATPITSADGIDVGVIGIDMQIATVSDFLGGLKIGETGAAIMLGANGDVIAHPDTSKLKKPKLDGESGLRFTTIEEIDDPVARSAARALQKNESGVEFSTDQFVHFEVDHRAYDAVFAPVEFGNLDWTVVIYAPRDELLGDILQNRNRNIALAIAATVISIVLGWLISQALTRPLERMASFAHQITRGERVDVHALPKTFAEVEQVSTAFSRMTQWLHRYRAKNDEMHAKLIAWSRELEIRVEERTAALQSTNALLRVEIGERAEAERKLAMEVDEHRETSEKLEHAFAEAKSASQAKSWFLSSMSHELRTPLNAIIGFGQMLDGHAGSLTEKQKVEYTGHIVDSGERLMRLINQVLDLAEIEAGKTRLSLETIDPKCIIRRVLAETRVLAQPRDIVLVDKTADTYLPKVRADAMRTTQALVNLVGNAVKYNRDGGEVHVSALPSHDVLRITVADTGHGIPVARQGEVFEAFNRLGLEGSNVVGSGIGLSLTKELIEKMGGRVGFESVEGAGSTFWFELPVAASRAGQIHDSRVTEKKPKDSSQDADISNLSANAELFAKYSSSRSI